MRALIPLLLFALLPACSGKPKVSCKAESLQAFEAALAEIPPAQRGAITLKSLTEACPEPAGFANALSGFENVPPEKRQMTVAKAIAGNSSLWNRACKGGMDVFENLASAPPEKRGALLWKGCAVDRFGFATEAEAQDKPLAMVAVVYAQVLEDAGVDKARRTRFLRALMGL